MATKDEWIARAVALGCANFGLGYRLSLTNDEGTACYATGGSSFAGALQSVYWSSSTSEVDPIYAPLVDLSTGLFFDVAKGFAMRVWPVRGGRR